MISVTADILEGVADSLRGWGRVLSRTTGLRDGAHVHIKECGRDLSLLAATIDECIDSIDNDESRLARDELVAYEGDVYELLADRLKEPLWAVKSDPNQALRRLLIKESL